MNIVKKIWTKLQQNILQNASNCTVFKKISRGSMPLIPPSKCVPMPRAAMKS